MTFAFPKAPAKSNWLRFYLFDQLFFFLWCILALCQRTRAPPLAPPRPKLGKGELRETQLNRKRKERIDTVPLGKFCPGAQFFGGEGLLRPVGSTPAFLPYSSSFCLLLAFAPQPDGSPARCAAQRTCCVSLPRISLPRCPPASSSSSVHPFWPLALLTNLFESGFFAFAL